MRRARRRARGHWLRDRPAGTEEQRRHRAAQELGRDGGEARAERSVTSAKVKNRSLPRTDFAPGQLAAGPVGPVGPAGPAGPAGPPGLSAVERVEVTSASNSSSTRTAAMACPAGKRLLGGGARLNPTLPQVALQSSFPDNDNIYRPTAREIVPTGSSWSLTVFAVCAVTS